MDTKYIVDYLVHPLIDMQNEKNICFLDLNMFVNNQYMIVEDLSILTQVLL